MQHAWVKVEKYMQMRNVGNVTHNMVIIKVNTKFTQREEIIWNTNKEVKENIKMDLGELW